MFQSNFMNLRALVMTACMMLLPIAAIAQTTITGVVRETSGEPVPGASVREKGTTNGAATDLDGNFSFKVSDPKATIVVSFVGYETLEVPLAGRKNLTITLKTDDELLEDVVVVGYGTMKKKLVTGATVEVKGDDIAKLNTTAVLGALQSQTPGVNIQSKSGQPGEGFNINIRGAGTNGSTTPLYIIDGVAGDINSLAPGDIERIDVLKDAASAAIYGARAANGVILITTKQGKAGKMQVSYDGYFGWQNAYKMPQLLTAKQYMGVMDQINVNSGGTPFDWVNIVGQDKYDAYMSGADNGTNWLEEIRKKNALTTSHAINITGGSDRSVYASGFSYMKQNGIFGGPAASDYSRFTARFNSEHVLWRKGDLDIVTFGENLYYNHNEKSGISIGSQYANPISDALRAVPIIPLYNENGEYFGGDDYGSETSGLKAYPGAGMYFSNPIYDLANSQDANNKSKNYSLSMTAYVKIQPLKGLTWKSQFGYKHSSSSWRGYLPIYDDNANVNKTRNVNSVNQNMSTGWSWSMEHTLNYKFDLADAHHFDILAGGSLERSGYNMGEYMEGNSSDLLFSDFQRAYLTNAQASTGVTVGGYPWGDSAIASYFGRINYDYKETYMASVVLRADGSSNFAKGHRWGWFPSVSAGWVLSNEKFMESTQSWLDFAKIRASFGQNGNCNIANFNYLATVIFDEKGQYPFNQKNGYSQGGYVGSLVNENTTWETSEQWDIGLDTRFLNNRLSFSFDWYIKNTKDLLIQAPVLLEYGLDAPYVNGGNVRNTGIEFAVNWKDHIGDLGYSINFNLAHNKNKVTKVANENGYINGSETALQTQGTYVYRMEVGHPIGYFIGYKTAGVIQNETDLQAYLDANCLGDAANSKQGTGIKPGDLKFVDTNGDGQVNDDDKVEIGSPHPTWTGGLGLQFDYKGFDLGLTFYGSFGNQIYKYWRNEGSAWYENYTTEVYKYWHGEGTSNTLPRLEKSSQSVNWTENSDIFCHNADYVRLQNITLGYNFKTGFKKLPIQSARLYFTIQNLFTITGYNGMDPENGNNAGAADSWASGLDLGYYPAPRTFMVGVNLKF